MTPELEALAVLAARVEALTGPDREGDCLIWCAANGITPEWQGNCLVAGYEGVIGYIDSGAHQRNFSTNRANQGPGSIPAYTASLDAAMTLVPEGWHTALSGSDYGWKAEISPPSGLGNGWRSDLCKISPLAITAAALRAITPTQTHKGPHDEL